MKSGMWLAIILLGTATVLSAQPGNYSSWSRITGGDSTEEARGIVQTTDGGFAAVGYTTSSGAGGADFYLVKLDSNGTVNWSRTYGGLGDDDAYCVRQTSDGGFILAGSSGSTTDTTLQGYLVKTTSTGILQWSRKFSSTSSEVIRDLQVESDGNFIMTGSSATPQGSDVFLRKADSHGNQTWLRTIGRSTSDHGYSVAPVSGGYIVAGTTLSSQTDAYLIKTNTQGVNVWTHVLGGSGNDIAYVVRPASDGGYYLAGSTTSNLIEHRPWLLKATAQGAQSWSHYYGPSNGSGTFYAMEILPGGNIIAAGCINDYFYLPRLDSVGGVRWDHLYNGFASRNAVALSLTPTRDDGFTLAGYTYGIGARQLDFYIVRTSRDAMTWSAVPDFPLTVPASFALSAFPNPFNPQTTLAFSLPQTTRVELDVFDLTGRTVAVLQDGIMAAGEHRLSFDGNDLPSGLYFARVRAGETVVTRKLVLLK
jgi:hypothetical protein